MAQHDYVIANGTGAAVRSDLNNGLSAIVTQNSGATEPATTYAFMRWADTTAGVMKMRNSANNAWITLYQLDGEWTNIAFENGTAAAPSIYFKDSGTDTGFYSPGTDQVGISTGGTARLTIDANGNVNIDSNTLYVDASNNRVGLGTSSPADRLHVSGSNAGGFRLTNADNSDAISVFMRGGNGIANTTDNAVLSLGQRSDVSLITTGRVGIGTTSPGSTLDVAGNINVQWSTNRIATVFDNDYRQGLAFDSTNRQLRIFSTTNDSGGSIGFYTRNGAGASSTDYGTERARMDSSGRLLVGTSTAIGATPLQIRPSSSYYGIRVDGAAEAGEFYRYTADQYSTGLIFHKSRNATIGSNTIVQNNDSLGALYYYGANGTGYDLAAKIEALVDGTPGASNDMPGRLVFSTTADGASSPTERMRLSANGAVRIPFVYTDTTATAANVVVFSDGYIIRSTSSKKYKTDIETIANSYSDALLECRPVWYRSTCEKDNPDWGYWGFIAEEVAEVDPRLVFWKTVETSHDENGSVIETPCDPEPEGVQYDRFVPHLLNLIKRQKEQIEAMEARLSALEAS
jgi:hypothetical protein